MTTGDLTGDDVRRVAERLGHGDTVTTGVKRLARALGVTESTVFRWMAVDEARPDPLRRAMLSKLAKAKVATVRDLAQTIADLDAEDVLGPVRALVLAVLP